MDEIVNEEENKETVSKNIVEIPDFVREKGAEAIQSYREWWRISEEIKNHPSRWYQILKPGEEEIEYIDCNLPPATIQKRMKHLDKSELAEAMKQWGEIQKLKTKKTQLRRKWDSIVWKTQAGRDHLDVRKTEIIELFGKWKRAEEIKEILERDWGYFVPLPKLKDFYHANFDRIQELRDNWSKETPDFSLAHKRGRVEMLAHIANTQFDKYNQEQKFGIPHARECRAALDQIKKEIEGEQIHLNISGHIDIKQTLLINKTVDEITRKVNINSFIVALVAAKRGIDPMYLMNQLTTSYYHKYSGFTRGKIGADDMIQYPSKLIYNWQEIEEKNSGGYVEDAVEVGSISDKDEMRRQLIDRIRSKKKQMEAVSNLIKL